MKRIAVHRLAWVVALLPPAFRVDGKERARAVLGATLGLLVTALAGRWLAGWAAVDPWLVAPLGATAVLVFAMPASPLAQPWPVIGGNTISALVGMACAWAIDDLAASAAVAVAAAIAVMFLLRCLHPPGGATAMLVVLAHTGDPRFALFPVLIDSAMLVLVGVLYNTLTGRRYPHRQAAPSPSARGAGARFSAADLDAALAHYNQVLDVSRDDLEALLHHAEAAAYRRNLGELRCRDVMSRDPVTVARDTPIADAWSLMRRRRVKALPVVDRSRRIEGIVTLADFVRTMAAPGAEPPGAAYAALDPDPSAGMPWRVDQIMTRRVRVASASVHVIELLPLFSQSGHHHLPIVDADKTLVGILTESDLVRALHRAVRPE